MRLLNTADERRAGLLSVSGFLLLGGTGWLGHVIPPSGDATGATDQPLIAAAIAAGTCVLQSGATYYLSSPIAITSGFVLTAAGGAVATIRQGSSWSGTGETNANALFVANAVATGSSTTLAADEPVGEQTISVASSSGFAVGDHWRISQLLPSTQYGQQVGSATKTNCVGLIAAISGTTWTEGLDHAHYLGSTMTIQRIESVSHGVTISNIRFDCWDSSLTLPKVASAITASYAYDWTFENVEVAGFCAWAIDTTGCASFRGSIVDLGANSGVLKRWCAANWSTEVRTELLYRVRYHPQASYPIPKVFDRDDVRACFDEFVISHCEAACWTWGHFGCVTTITAHDIHCERMLTIGSPPTGEQTGSQNGFGVSTNANNINLAVFSQDNDWRIRVWDFTSGAAYKYSVDTDIPTNYASAVYWHDDKSSRLCARIENRNIYGAGPPYGSASRYCMVGLRIQDSFGMVDAVVQGFPYGCVTSGVFAENTGEIVLDGQPGTGLGSGISAFVAIGDLPPMWDRATILNYTAPMLNTTGQTALSTPAFARPFAKSLVWNNNEYGAVYWAVIPFDAGDPYGTIGKGYAFDAAAAAGTRQLVMTSPAGLPGVVLVSQAAVAPQTVLCTLAPGGSGVVTSGAAIARGDRLELNAAGKAIPYVAGRIIGVATSKATGADQAVTYGPD